MRRIAGPKPGSLVPFVPDGMEEDGLRVFLKAPSEAEKRDYLVEVTSIISFKPGETEATVSLATAYERQEKRLARWVAGVEGYEDQDGNPIATGADLWARGEPEVVGPVDYRIQQLLGLVPDEPKKSSGSHATSPAVTPLSDGTVASVSQPDASVSVTATDPRLMPTGSRTLG